MAVDLDASSKLRAVNAAPVTAPLGPVLRAARRSYLWPWPDGACFEFDAFGG